MIHWLRTALHRQAATLCAVGLSLAAASLVGVWTTGVLPWPDFDPLLVFCAGFIPAASLVVGWVTRLWLTRRLARLTGTIDAATGENDLLRLEDQGPDEVGEVGRAVNRLLARVTELNASLIDQGRTLEHTQAELALGEQLAQKNQELQQRLSERAMLFEVLRMTSSSMELHEVLWRAVQRIASALSLRECALCLREDGRFVVRAAEGFEDAEKLLGRAVEEGEGLVGEVGRTGARIVEPDVRESARYLGFWGEAPMEGTVAAMPVTFQGELLGVLTASRPADNPLTDVEIHLLAAICDQVALAVHNAQLFEQLRDLSTHDELTGLANRRLLRSQLDMEVERCRRFALAISAIVLDIDHFKLLNDREGHGTGDAALKQVADVLRDNVRAVDTLARVGGEEFVVVLPRADGAEAAQVAEKLRAAVAGARIAGGEGQPGGRLTISLGVAQWRDGDRSPSAVLDRADKALYEAKRGGRNRVHRVD